MNYKQMCIQQRYVPSTCTMDGQYCWLLINDQKDPCKGCNENRSICNGRHTPYNNKFLMQKERIEENKRRQDEVKQQRKMGHMNGYTRTILEVKWELLHNERIIEIIVKDIINEKAYIAKCRDIHEMLSMVNLCCKKYNIEQIHVEENSLGMGIYDFLNIHIKDIDIVPLRYSVMKL